MCGFIQVKVLRSMQPLLLENVIVGQYKGHNKGSKSYPAYTDDPTVPKGSLTPTFSAAALFINNARWDGFLSWWKQAKHSIPNGRQYFFPFHVDLFFHHVLLYCRICSTGWLENVVSMKLQCRDQSSVQTCPWKPVQAEFWNWLRQGYKWACAPTPSWWSYIPEDQQQTSWSWNEIGSQRP